MGWESWKSFDSPIRFRTTNHSTLTHSLSVTSDAFDSDPSVHSIRRRFLDEYIRRRRSAAEKANVCTNVACVDGLRFSIDEITVDVSLSQVDLCGLMKFSDMETFLFISWKRRDYNANVAIYESPSLPMDELFTSGSVHSFKLSHFDPSDSYSDRLLYFAIRNTQNGQTIGECSVSWPSLVRNGRCCLKIKPRDLTGSLFFGATRKSSQSIGVVHIDVSTRNSAMSSSSQGARSSSSNVSLERLSQSPKEDDDVKEKSNVMFASGKTQAYLISLLAPSVQIRLRQPYAQKSQSSQYGERNACQ
ncbi:hypothetical protein AB6A40_003121 [Gnathostoma spinigerum]|uniref:Uncharacterized protein n=1 Tax=Gnathostoma spinigerum TaxID=75299 RepID=A0ABD6EIA1_9BILA